MADTQQSAPRAPYTVPEEPRATLASNILAIIGFIILIVVVIWGLVHLAGISRSWFGSLFGTGTVIEVSAPESATSGTPFTVSWQYNEPGPGRYALLYPCERGLQFQTPALTGNVLNGIPCGAAFTISGEDKKVSVLPLLTGNESLDVPISIIFLGSATGTPTSTTAGSQAQGSATVTISPASTSTPVVTSPQPSPAPSAPSPASPSTGSTGSPQASSGQAAPAAATPADLSVQILSVTVSASGEGVATFNIANIGGKASSTYYFTAMLPTRSGSTYASPAQTSLAPSAHVVSTLRFSGAVSGVFSVSITTPDANGSNNYASQSLSAPYSYGSYNPPSPYPYQAQYSSAYYPYTYQNPTSYYQYQYPYSQQSPYSTYYPYAY